MWGQALKFGIIGIVATAVHMLIGLLLIQTGWSAAWANPTAFTVAFVVSFVGHWGYSFADQQVKMSIALWRFAIVGLTGFGCNEAVVIALISFNLVADAAALIISTSIAALVTFCLSRSWAFAAYQTSGDGKFGATHQLVCSASVRVR